MRRWAIPAVKIAISLGLCALLLWEVNWEEMRAQLQGASTPLLLAGLFFVALQVFLTTWRWDIVLTIIGAPIRLIQALKISLVANTFAQLLPIASGGDVIRVWQAKREGMLLSTAMNGVVLERLTGLLALMGMLCLSLPALAHRMENPAARYSLLIALLALLGGMILLLAGRYILQPFTRWKIFRYIIRLSEDTFKIIGAGWGFVAILAISVAGLLSWCFAVYAFAHAVNLELSLIDAVILVLPVILILALPFSLTGWGVREGAMVLTLGLAGLGYEQALLVSILTGFAFLLTGLPGAFMILFLGKKKTLGDMPENLPYSDGPVIAPGNISGQS